MEYLAAVGLDRLRKMTSGILLATNEEHFCNISLYCKSFIRQNKTEHEILNITIYTDFRGQQKKVKVSKREMKDARHTEKIKTDKVELG